MKLLAVLTESHRDLYERFFLPSLPPDMELVTHAMNLAGDGSYRSKTWQQGVVGKLGFALEHIRANPGSVFILSDVDIRFFDGFESGALLGLLEKSACDILFQRETANGLSGEVNTGFYIARCSEYTEALVRRAIEECSAQENANDQVAINHLLDPADRGIRWDLLPAEYYARSHGFPPPPGIRIHHANFTSTVEEKAIQLARIRSYAAGGNLTKALIVIRESMDYLLSGKLIGMLCRKLGNTNRCNDR